MALTTTPDAIPTPASGDAYALVTDLLATADRIQAVLTTKANYGVGTTTERTAALSRFPDGAVWYDTTLSAEYRRVAGAWVAVPAASEDAYNYRWADAAARTAQAGMIAGDKGYQTDTAVVYRYSGSAWVAWESDWITWTTAPTGVTVGTGGSASSTQRYKWVAGRLCFEYTFVLGTSGASVGTNPNLNLPLNIKTGSPSGMIPAGDGGVIYDSSAAGATGFTRHFILTATTVRLYSTTTGTPAYATITSTVPMTWAAGDYISGSFWADPA